MYTNAHTYVHAYIQIHGKHIMKLGLPYFGAGGVNAYGDGAPSVSAHDVGVYGAGAPSVGVSGISVLDAGACVVGNNTTLALTAKHYYTTGILQKYV